VTTLTRYALYQIPGIIVFALILAVLWRATSWPVSWAVVSLALWIVKDAAVYPLVRDAYERSDADHGGGLVGSTAVVVEALAPDGRVRVRGELWRARLHSENGERAASAIPGTTVFIERIEGLRLIVSAHTRPKGGG
jgi:membrane protein implicated in regulation of membrane protease activity